MFRLLKYALLLVFFSLLGCVKKSQPTAFEELLQEGHEVFYSDTLRFDQKEFVVAALKLQNEDSLMQVSDEGILRPLLILEKQSSGSFDIALRNDKVILCASCGGAFGNPLEGIEINEKELLIYHHAGSRYRWTRHLSFKFMEDPNGWFLTSDKGFSFDSFDPEGDMKEVIYTQIEPENMVSFESFDVYSGFDN